MRPTKVNMPIALAEIILMLATAITSAQETGASAAFTSEDPLVKTALQLVNNGNFAEAEKLLSSDSESRDREELLEIIRRLRHEYSQTQDQLLTKLQKTISDVKPEDLRKWREADEVQYRVIDGQIAYFRREPSNIFRFCNEAKQRARRSDSDPDKAPDFELIDHLQAVVNAADSSDSPMVVPAHHRIIYKITVPVKSLRAGGKVIQFWLPYPQEYRQQTNVKLIRSELKAGEEIISAEPVIAPNAIDGSNVQHAQRTIFFEVKLTGSLRPITAEVEYEFTSHAYHPKLHDEAAVQLPANWGDAYLIERLPHIVFDDRIKTQVARIIGDETNPLKKLRKIFHWCDGNIRYHAEEEYGVLSSFAIKCFERKRGDCGVQSTLFITMCRIAGIPARWQSGWETKPSGYNMHDWAEVYVAPWGWIPCDVSYGLQKSDDPRVREFYIGHQDSHRMIVNLDYGRTLHPPKKSLRSEPADFQRGEVEIDGKNLYFNEFDHSIRLFVDGRELNE